MILLVVGIPPVFGWLAGLGLLLWSPLWSARQKLLGALVWPGGFSTALLFMMPLGRSEGCSSNSGIGGGPVETICSHSGPPAWLGGILAAVLLLAPILVAIYLFRAAGRRAAA